MTYPIIMNGDHAEFEAEWAGKDPKDRPDWPLPSFDALDWAEAFVKRVSEKPGIATDEGTMLAWFAGALMRGYDEQSRRRQEAAQAAEGSGTELLAWAVARWQAEVANRPLQNIHRRTLDTTWRQVIRRFGGDTDALVGPHHDLLLDEQSSLTPGKE